MPTNISNALTLPPMFMVRQNFEVPPRLDIEATMETVFLDTSEEGLPLFLDRLALSAALMTIRPSQPDEIGIVYIKNTLDLRRMMVSQAYAEQLERDPSVVIETKEQRLP